MSLLFRCGRLFARCLGVACFIGVMPACAAVLGIEEIPTPGDFPVEAGGKTCKELDKDLDQICVGAIQMCGNEARFICDENHLSNAHCECPSSEGGSEFDGCAAQLDCIPVSDVGPPEDSIQVGESGSDGGPPETDGGRDGGGPTDAPSEGGDAPSGAEPTQ